MFPRQRGVALVITLIMLAVITFMAVTFLAVSRREAGSVTVTRDQTTARLAADNGLERVKAELLAGILGTTNPYNFDLLVSTNYLSPVGYDPGAQTIGIPNVTNVNYRYARSGNPITGNDALQNQANLWYNPRPPVFITNRTVANSTDFRFYLDLNRNRLYDTNGLLPVIGYDPNNPFYDTNGNVMPLPTVGITASNHFIGDPEWIGILERPNLPHSATNRFIARYAYIVVPSGKTLDVNYVHNEAKLPSARQEGFFRNQGVGSWEMNLAGFLVDLNTNQWQPQINPYSYSTDIALASRGAAFEDALLLVNYRYNNNYPVYLRPVATLFPQGVVPFRLDRIDGYSHGPLMTTYWGWNVPQDGDLSPVDLATTRVWPGSENYNHFFTTQEFFDRAKISYNKPGLVFTDRLLIAGTNNPNNSLYGPSSYDRYTFYRLLSQLGIDSATESPSKINLNYLNAGGVSVTNFIAWDDPEISTGNSGRGIPRFNVPGSVLFFTNAADKLLRQYTSEWRDADTNLFRATFGVTDAFGVTNIPVWVSNRFVYTPSVHRLLQLAANIYDSMTNHVYAGATNLPTVFRPRFERRPNNDIYIANFVEVISAFTATNNATMRSLTDTNVAAFVQPNDLIFGVPLVIGAKKGLPNFNEFAMQTVFQATRKLEIRRASLSASPGQWTTNMMYVVGISNIIGAEAWNSYRANYTRPVDIHVTHYLDMRLTNDYGLNMTLNPAIVRDYPIPHPTNAVWSGYSSNNPNASFVIPLRTNVVFLPDAAFVPGLGFVTDLNLAWDKSQTFRSPQYGLTVTNRLQFLVVDRLSGRLIDYVQLEGLNGFRDLGGELRSFDNVPDSDPLWKTNIVAGGYPEGIRNQILTSLGIPVPGINAADWKAYDLGSHATKDFEIAYFRALYNLPSPQYPFLVNTSLWNQVPFTPTKRISQYLTWQANDPLVHYTSGDLAYLAAARTILENLRTPVQTIKNIGFVNDRYQPWGENRIPNTDATKYSTAIKDAGVRRSDDWAFPTNKFPNIGWLGRVHRGTPWQTIYLKSADVLRTGGLAQWTNWTGNANVHVFDTNLVWDAYRTVPESDRLLFDLFTTGFNENATRGQLSVNQSGLAAWSALFSGVIALTNSSPDPQLNTLPPIFEPYPTTAPGVPLGIQPVGTDGPNSPLFRIVQDINNTRADTNRFPGGVFRHVGDILAVPSLTTNSPFLNRSTAPQLQLGINDTVYEWLPQQVMSLLQVGEPRFVVYSYGQTLRPAPASIVPSGAFQGLCTNYQVTAEMATRAVVRIEGSPDPSKTDTSLLSAKRYPPRVVIEKYSLLPPD